VGGTAYYLYGNTFYRAAPGGAADSFVAVSRPAGTATLSEMPSGAQAVAVGSLTYYLSQGRYYLPYMEPNGTELYVLVDPPPAPAAAPGTMAAFSLVVPPGTPVVVRLATSLRSDQARSGQRFQGNLAEDLETVGSLVASQGARVYGRVTAAEPAATANGRARLELQLTDIEAGGAVVAIATAPLPCTSRAKEPLASGGSALAAAVDGAAAGAAPATNELEATVAPPLTFRLTSSAVVGVVR
jgi:hypothetical protein